MRKNRKLKLGDRVLCRFLGAVEFGTIIEITELNKYKVKCDKGLILPKSEWYDPMDAIHMKKAWHIHEYISSTTVSKPIIELDSLNDTLDKNKLDNAIKKQKAFIRGQYQK